MRKQFIGALAACTLAFGLSACGTNLDGAAPESPQGKEHSASINQNGNTQTEWAGIEQTGLDLILHYINLAGCTFTIDNSIASFVPSAELAPLIGDPARSPLRFPVPCTTWSPSWPLPDVTICVSHMQANVSDLKVQLGSTSVNGNITLSGRVHAHTAWPWPDADLVIDRAVLQATLTYDEGTGRLVPNSVATDIEHHTENCGLFGWCDGVVNHNLPDLSDKLRSLFNDQLVAILGKPTAVAALPQNLVKAWNALNPGDLPWNMASPSQLSISGGRFNFQVVRTFPPKAPTAWGADELCNGIIDVHSDNVDTLQLQRLWNSEWTLVAQGNPDEWGYVDLEDRTLTGSTGVFTYRLCAVNSAGTSCANPFTVTVTPATGCGGGGGGGGGPPPRGPRPT